MKIGIITYHRAHNCGAMLQAWALKKALEKFGHEADYPALNRVGEPQERWLSKPIPTIGVFARIRSVLASVYCNMLSVPIEEIKRIRFSRFRRKFLRERVADVSRLGESYDAVIVGSDQVWKPAIAVEWTPLFLGEILPHDIRRVAYALSYGDKELEGDELDRAVKAIGNFDALSVREPIMKGQLQPFTKKELKLVVDPSLLINAEEYDELIRDFDPPKKDYLFAYLLGGDEALVAKIREVAKKLGVVAIITVVYQYSRHKAPKGLTYAVSPERMLGYIKNAKYVFAASFHGTAFSIIFGKRFVSLRPKANDFTSRPGALLEKIGEKGRLVSPETSVDEIVVKLRQEPANWTEKLAPMQGESIGWLREVL